MPKAGLEFKYPNYTIPKDENMTYFKHVTNHTRGKPDPQKHHTELSWKTPNGNFGKGDKRKTFTDVAQEHSKKVPAPGKYNANVKWPVFFGTMKKTEGVDYLSDCQFIGKTIPGPSTYKLDHKWT